MTKFKYPEYSIDGVPFIYDDSIYCFIHDLDDDPFVCEYGISGNYLQMSCLKYYDLDIDRLDVMRDFISEAELINDMIIENEDGTALYFEKEYLIEINSKFLDILKNSINSISGSFEIDSNGILKTDNDNFSTFINNTR